MEVDDYEYADHLEDYIFMNYDNTDETLNGFEGNTYLFYFGKAVAAAESRQRVARFKKEDDGL